MTGPRQTLQVQLVLRALLQRPHEQAYGYAIATRTGLSPGTVYRILSRLETASWVEARWEDLDTAHSVTRRKCFFRLTPAGLGLARAVLAARVHDTSP